ncbi:hypothetical protein Enr13x_78760 [Stieleria neptunia]|uniref:YcxB-like protein domain-containing protein n=1 Tax=Stieleria neptunia TaxID=2527979 RepID=A0A518I4D8_9BACT|nr:YcxB family protein [Stieleria neptunia]QDV47964.1 hypothetical protein Enr13x_78760 [Stieleria neptunia]
MLENPYRPPSSDFESAVSDQYEFSGEVTEDDIARLLSVSWINLVLLGLCVLVIAPFLAVLAFAGLSAQNSIRFTAAALAFVSMLAMICGAAFWATTRSRIARRLVRMQPNLVGGLSGEINSNGLFLFNKHVTKVQYTWSSFSGVTVNRNGIRFDLGYPRTGLIGIPARCIDGYDFQSAREQINRFRAVDESEPVFRCILDWSKAPSDALRFEIPIPNRNSNPAMNSGAFSFYWPGAMAFIAGSLAFILLLSEMMIAASIAGALCWVALEKALAVRREVLPGTPEPQEFQWGWMHPTGLHVCHGDHEKVVQWSDVKQLRIGETTVAVVSHDHSMFEIPIQDFLDDDWERIGELVQSLVPQVPVVSPSRRE